MADTLEFAAVTDRLATMGISLGDVAEYFGVRRETVSRWRREGGMYPPPEGWRITIAELAEGRGHALLEFARSLNRDP